MPFVALSNNVMGLSSARGNGRRAAIRPSGIDDFNGTLPRHALSDRKGHRRIVFAGDVSYPWPATRFEGYRRGMREKKLSPY